MARTIAASLDGSGTPSAELWRLALLASPEAVDAAAELLRESGAYGVEILGPAAPPTGDDIIAPAAARAESGAAIWLPARQARQLAQTLHALVQSRLEPVFGPVRVEAGPAPAVDWVREYRKSVGPIRVAPGLWVEPPWRPATPAAGERVLRVMPGAAFGYGDHATTVTCLRLLLERVRPGQDVIDMGSGSGILGAAALAFGAGRLRAYDLDPLALAATRDTLRRNGLRGYVRQGSLPGGGRPADIILANISGRGVRPYLPLLRRRLAPGGCVILGGILRDDSTFDGDVRAAGLQIAAAASEGDWRAVAAERA